MNVNLLKFFPGKTRSIDTFVFFKGTPDQSRDEMYILTSCKQNNSKHNTHFSCHIEPDQIHVRFGTYCVRRNINSMYNFKKHFLFSFLISFVDEVNIENHQVLTIARALVTLRH